MYEKKCGYISVSPTRIKLACNIQLKSIKRARTKDKHKFVNKQLEYLLYKYNNSWFKWFKRKPTRRDAIYDYLHGGYLPEYVLNKYRYSNSEKEAQELLKAAEASEETFMWIPTNAYIITVILNLFQ